jgi:hypothetical protein
VVRQAEAVGRVTIRNDGFFPARNFTVAWNPSGSTTNFFSPSKPVVELLAGASTTVEISSSYPFTGTFTSAAMVDAGNTVIESNETNNTATTTVVVGERTATLRVNYNSFIADHAFADGLNGDGEWFHLLAAFNPGGHCTANIDLSILPGSTQIFSSDGVSCTDLEVDGVNDGENHGLNRSLTVTIPDTLPLVIGGAALEIDDFLGLFVTGGDFTGAWLAVIPFEDAVKGKSGQTPADPANYRVNWSVTVLTPPPPVFGA